MIKEKRGQVTEALFVPIALVLTITALFYMSTNSSKITLDSSEMIEQSNNIVFGRQYVNAQTKLLAKQAITSNQPDLTAALKQKSAEKEEEFRYIGAGNLYAKIRNNEFTFSQQGETYKLEIKNILIQTESGASRIVSNFAVCHLFDAQGGFIKNC